MDRIYKEFNEARKKPLLTGIGIIIFILIGYFAFLQSSYALIGLVVVGLLFVIYDFYSDVNFNRYLSSQKSLVKENPELVMKNLSELFSEMQEANKHFEEDAFALGNRHANELIEDKKRKKRKQRKEVYDIVFAIKDYLRKQNNIK